MTLLCTIPTVPICDHHRPMKLGYLEWYYYCEASEKAGYKQTQCPTCKRWLWPDEIGTEQSKNEVK